MIKRNEPCWCGSGKKYKKCHLRADEASGNKSGGQKKKSPYAKSTRDIAGMRRAGAFNGQLMDYVRPFVKVGVSTLELNERIHEYTLRHGHRPAPLGYRGYPKSSCISRNEVVCHGIPSAYEKLEDGDIVNIDVTSIVDGYYGDSSETFLVGNVSDEAKKLVKVTAQCLMRAIEAIGPAVHVIAISEAIQPYAKKHGYSVVREFTGHGIGKQFHEHFSVNHHKGLDCDDVILQPGMTFTIEPMINQGSWRTVIDSEDGWTARTKDGQLSAQFEHTLLITEEGVEVLTLTPAQKRAGKMLIIDGIEL